MPHKRAACVRKYDNMNDPGLDSTISQEATTLNRHRTDPERDLNDFPELRWVDEERVRSGDVAEAMRPVRWWFASTAFPLLAVCAYLLFSTLYAAGN